MKNCGLYLRAKDTKPQRGKQPVEVHAASMQLSCVYILFTFSQCLSQGLEAVNSFKKSLWYVYIHYIFIFLCLIQLLNINTPLSIINKSTKPLVKGEILLLKWKNKLFPFGS